MKSRLLAIISAVIGLALFVYVIRQTGVEEIAARLRQLGSGFVWILAISACRYLTRSLSWLRCISPEDRHVGFWTLWRARLAGEAIGDLTAGPLVAEPLKAMVLGDKVSLASRVSSLAVENITYTVSSCVMVMAGAIALLTSFGMAGSLRVAMRVSLAAVILVIIASVIVIGRRWKLGSGTAVFLVRMLIRDQAKRTKLESKIVHLAELEEYIFDFFAKRPMDFFLVILCQMSFHLAGVTEIFVTMKLIGAHLSFATAFLMESVNRALNIAFTFVPAMVGVDELGTRELAKVLGFDGSFGVALAIIRKIRMFFWIGIGLMFLAAARRKK
ncbi:MAG: flippase-like domain-containing protein [Acidobacteria bacterium]|nr:flippase-like domain-containing protein [Acidobacteriota bacterium]